MRTEDRCRVRVSVTDGYDLQLGRRLYRAVRRHIARGTPRYLSGSSCRADLSLSHECPPWLWRARLGERCQLTEEGRAALWAAPPPECSSWHWANISGSDKYGRDVLRMTSANSRGPALASFGPAETAGTSTHRCTRVLLQVRIRLAARRLLICSTYETANNLSQKQWEWYYCREATVEKVFHVIEHQDSRQACSRRRIPQRAKGKAQKAT